MPQPEITVYRTASCPYCIQAVETLRGLGLAFEEISLDGHPDRRAATEAILPGHRTVPLILIDGRPIGGNQELQELLAQGGVDALLAAGKR